MLCRGVLQTPHTNNLLKNQINIKQYEHPEII